MVLFVHHVLGRYRVTRGARTVHVALDEVVHRAAPGIDLDLTAEPDRTWDDRPDVIDRATYSAHAELDGAMVWFDLTCPPTGERTAVRNGPEAEADIIGWLAVVDTSDHAFELETACSVDGPAAGLDDC